ncbi:MAG: peptide deformylase [Bacteroidota bacterium]
MATLPIYLYGSEVLRVKAKPVKDLDPSVIKLVYDMFETMHKANGIGLAATQVGDRRRVIVIDISDVNEAPDEDSPREVRQTSPDLPRTLVMINPEIVEEVDTVLMEEGCLSIPDVRSEVRRAEKARIRFHDANFQEMELTMDGLLARVALHEIDHLDGILFVDRISTAKRGLLKGKLRAIKNGDVETSYPVVTAAEV